MTLMFDIASVMMIATGCCYGLLAFVAYSSYRRAGSKFLLLFMGGFLMLSITYIYGGVAGAYHPFNGGLFEYVLSEFALGGFLSDVTVKNMVVFEALGVVAVVLFIIALYKAYLKGI